jgi:hypothetical protein
MVAVQETLPTLVSMGPARMVTLDLTAGETYPLLVNALTEYAVALDESYADCFGGNGLRNAASTTPRMREPLRRSTTRTSLTS